MISFSWAFNQIIIFFFPGNPVKRRAVAFHAEMDKDIRNLPNYHKVVFATVHLNEGGAYDPKSGIFTCKDPGIYIFDWTILTEKGQHFFTDLMVDGVVRGNLHLDNRGNAHNGRSASKMIVIKLKAGSKVWLEPHSTMVGVYANRNWSTFSGFKLWRLLYNVKLNKRYYHIHCISSCC